MVNPFSQEFMNWLDRQRLWWEKQITITHHATLGKKRDIFITIKFRPEIIATLRVSQHDDQMFSCSIQNGESHFGFYERPISEYIPIFEALKQGNSQQTKTPEMI